jgi:hypothetical protein
MSYLFMNIPHPWLTVRMNYLVAKPTAGYLMSKSTLVLVKRRFAGIETLARAKTPAAKIAKQPKHSVGAVRQKALGLGVSLNSRA